MQIAVLEGNGTKKGTVEACPLFDRPGGGVFSLRVSVRGTW
jgi:hypothetical protein